jgi:hypothetical protein
VIKMISEISKGYVQAIDVVLKLGLLIIYLLVLLLSGHLGESVIQGTEVSLKACLHIT